MSCGFEVTGEQPSAHGDGEPLQGVAISTGSPSGGETVFVGVELQSPGGREQSSTFQHNFEHLGGRHAGTEFTRHRG